MSLKSKVGVDGFRWKGSADFRDEEGLCNYREQGREPPTTSLPLLIRFQLAWHMCAYVPGCRTCAYYTVRPE
jgi:hypothetical protein